MCGILTFAYDVYKLYTHVVHIKNLTTRKYITYINLVYIRMYTRIRSLHTYAYKLYIHIYKLYIVRIKKEKKEKPKKVKTKVKKKKKNRNGDTCPLSQRVPPPSRVPRPAPRESAAADR